MICQKEWFVALLFHLWLFLSQNIASNELITEQYALERRTVNMNNVFENLFLSKSTLDRMNHH